MSSEIDPSRLSEEEITRQMKMLNSKQLWKDPNSLTTDSLINCLSIQPFKTLSSYNYWINKNLIYIPEEEEYIYISGCNIIIEKISTKIQDIIPLTHKCYVTSLTYIKTSSNEKLLFIGEKLFPDDKKMISGGIEIIHIEKKNNYKKLNLDLGAYVDYNSYVYDIIAGKNNEICVIVLKNLNTNINEVKLFFYNYVSFSLIDIEDIKYNLSNLIINPDIDNQYLMIASNYCTLWNFNINKLQLLLTHQFYKDNKNIITYAEFIKVDDKEGIVISFKNEWVEIFMKLSDEEYQVTGNLYNLFLRVDLFYFFKDTKIEINNISEQEQIQEVKDPEEEEEIEEVFMDNLIQSSTNDFMQDLGPNKITLNKTDNYPSLIICRNNFIFIFLKKTEILVIFELIDVKNEPKIKISNIELLSHKIIDNYYISMNNDITKMIFISGDLDEKALLSSNKPIGDNNIISQNDKGENNFNLQKIALNYYKYKINYINGIPNFEFEGKFLENTSLIHPIQDIAISQSPRIIIVNNGYENQDLFFFNQKISSDLNTYLKQNSNNFEGNYRNYTQLKHDYYKENSNYNLFIYKKLDDKPLSICFSPQGKSFFVSYKDCGYLYIILEREIKEVFKIAMYCRSCTFDQTGSYLAFGTSEFDNDYNINILNLSSYEYEYIITKVPQPTKLLFIDGARNLIAQFNDNSTNILGWSLNWDHRLIENFSSAQKEKMDNYEKNSKIILKISDFTGNIVDFGYDYALDMCIISSHDKRQRIYCGIKDDKHWEFSSDTEYTKLLILKKYDSIVFGTEEGYIRACIWPIQNMNKDMSIDHPEYIETKLHNSKITSLCISKDLEFLYSGAEDGSIFISSICALSNDIPLELKNFYYFDNHNVLPKKIYFTQDEIMYITDNIYQNKVENLKKKKSSIQGMISEFQSKKEKINQNNVSDLENQRAKLTELLEQKVKEVKEKELEKEKETKKLKDEREQQFKKLKDDLFEMKKKFKVQKEKKQNETTKLINCIKFAKEKYEQKKVEIENLRKKTNNNITNCLENILTILQDKKNEIDKLVTEKTKKFEIECEKNEGLYETEIRQKEAKFKQSLEEFEEQKKETDNEIMKKYKDNKNYDEKINEWENHLKELKINNEELMETYIFNTLKLNQMNQLLTDNENKISIKEKIVKEKRLVNDRLEQLRFVLEYQIKNLILEKTPIEEQIKNFESLHSDFYKRFNLLYTELLNIGDLIENNQKCIDTYREELSETKKSLYRLKNLYKSIDVALNSILKNKLDTKKDIIDQIFQVYQTYLYTFNDAKKQTKFISNEMKLQTQNIEKEIYNQKNNVLKELIDKRAERRRIIIEKEDMMKDIRLDNQLLIQECSNIRENLEDILKNINDIEKKFIELTNNNTFLSDKSSMEKVQDIQGRIKETKKKVLLNDEDKHRVGKMNKGEKLPPIKSKKLIPIVSNGNNIDILNAEELLKKQKINTEELMKQQRELEDIQKRYKEFVGEQEIDNSDVINSQRNKIGNNFGKKSDEEKIVSIKMTKHYDGKKGNIKK